MVADAMMAPEAECQMIVGPAVEIVLSGCS
jgi:hypothetical protein